MASIDTTPSTVATNALQSLPFGTLIGGPLAACVEAQAKAAKSSWEFIRDVGLTDTEDGGKKAIYVNFEYRKDGRSVTLSLPLLTIVPIPYMAIREIDIAFKARISAAASSSKTEHKSLAVEAGMTSKVGFNALVASGSVEMSTSLSSKKDSTASRHSKYSVEYTMDVSVKAGQDDMPAGMAKVLEMLNSSIDSIDTKGELHVSDQVVSLAGGGSTYISYKNNEGYYKPADIKLYEYKDSQTGSEVKADDCQRAADDAGMLCVFKKEGFYCAKAGERMLVINVTK